MDENKAHRVVKDFFQYADSEDVMKLRAENAKLSADLEKYKSWVLDLECFIRATYNVTQGDRK